MQNRCPNPACDAVYNFTAKHVGRQFNCQKCGTALVVEQDGLHLAGGAAPVAAAPVAPAGDDFEMEPPVRKPSRGGKRGIGFEGLGALQDLWLKVSGPIATGLVGFGTFLVIIFLFFPLIDLAKISRRGGAIDEGERRLKQLRADAQPGMPGGDDEKKREEARKKYEEEQKKWITARKPLQEDYDSAVVGFSRWLYIYAWGMLLGFLCLAFGSIGYLHPQHGTARRIVGAIILCGQVFLLGILFITFVIVSAGATAPTQFPRLPDRVGGP